MKFSELKYLVVSDLCRYGEGGGYRSFLKNFIRTPGFRYSVIMRLSGYIKKNNPLRYSLGPIVLFLHWHYSIKYGIEISSDTKIGRGFYIGHYGGVVIHPDVVIGDNCNISHGVTIGQTNRGQRQGCPVIGRNVYIGPGAKIIGRVLIGDNVAIGANCVVTKDAPENSVVVGVPGRVISSRGASDYIRNTDDSD